MSLASTFLARVSGPLRFAILTLSELDAAMRGLLDAARKAWPAVTIDDEVFIEHVAARLPAEGEGPNLLAAVFIADLYLACACALGEPRALAAFDRRILRPARVALASFEGKGTVVDEALQVVREKLLLRDGDEPPRIADYAGQGSLEGWVKVTLMRTALNLTRSKVREAPGSYADAAEEPLAAASDPELALIKAEHREAFALAFRAALASLSVDERNLLRFYIVDRLNIAAIGVILKVHRATVARWINEVRAKLLEATHAGLGERLGISGSEVASLVGALQSQIELSLGSFLGPKP